MAEIKAPKTKVILQPKKNPQVKDPPRYPKVINEYENEMNRSFAPQINKMLMDITKKMVSYTK